MSCKGMESFYQYYVIGFEKNKSDPNLEDNGKNVQSLCI